MCNVLSVETATCSQMKLDLKRNAIFSTTFTKATIFDIKIQLKPYFRLLYIGIKTTCELYRKLYQFERRLVNSYTKTNVFVTHVAIVTHIFSFKPSSKKGLLY